MKPERVFMLVQDLFFAARIGETAAQLGIVVEELRPDRAVTASRNNPPDLLLVDLHAKGDPLELIRVLKADDRTRRVRIVGFYAHVDHERAGAAQRAGADLVLPRSAFSVRLPEILAGEAP